MSKDSDLVTISARNTLCCVFSCVDDICYILINISSSPRGTGFEPVLSVSEANVLTINTTLFVCYALQVGDRNVYILSVLF